MIFAYGQREMDYLAGRDARLGQVIRQLGFIPRQLEPDLFRSLAFSIVGQQISMAAQKTVWGRLEAFLGQVSPAALAAADPADLQALGMNGRKADYLQNLARRVESGELELQALAAEDDETVIRQLSALRGVGVWTAEMMLIFSLGRPDVLSWGDLAIQRGLRMLYRKKKITRQDFARYKKRYSPWATVAGFYLWAVSAGEVPGLTDPAEPAQRKPPQARRAAKVKQTERVFHQWDSPLGKILLESDGRALTGLRFWEGEAPPPENGADASPAFPAAERWLEACFSGQAPGEPPPLAPAGTDYQKAVWKQLAGIPRGQTVSYKALAERVTAATGHTTSARAVGGAVGKNPIVLMLPCHRVIGADGSLTGYAYGLERKKWLLVLEGEGTE